MALLDLFGRPTIFLRLRDPSLKMVSIFGKRIASVNGFWLMDYF